MTITVITDTVEVALDAPPEIVVTVENGQGPAGAPGDLLEQSLPFDPTLLFENALA